ncbi:MAG: Asp/Glu/hydantoin racemase [Casimicrobiaceae bacterium]
MANDTLSPRERFAAPTRFLGWITPSANTVVERVTLGILREFPEVSPHFSRTSVVGARDPFPTSYHLEDMLAAAQLLADARLDVVAWNGSKGGSLNFALDHDLVARIEQLTGARSTTSTLAIDGVLREDGVKRFGLACPYVDAYRDRIVATFAREGYECVAARNAGLSDNYSFSQMRPDAIVAMLRDVARSRPQAIITFCTNFPAAPLVGEMEDELGVPIYDTVTMAVWGALRLVGVDTGPGRAWGRVFAR